MSANAVEAANVPSTADFQSLEEKVLRTIELLKAAREAKAAAAQEIARLQEELQRRDDVLRQRGEEVDNLQRELVAFRLEREEVRTRIEKMLHQIDTLTAEESA